VLGGLGGIGDKLTMVAPIGLSHFPFTGAVLINGTACTRVNRYAAAVGAEIVPIVYAVIITVGVGQVTDAITVKVGLFRIGCKWAVIAAIEDAVIVIIAVQALLMPSTSLSCWLRLATRVGCHPHPKYRRYHRRYRRHHHCRRHRCRADWYWR